jgi:hypothetical protein
MTCEKCGKTLEIGEFPFCGHGFPGTREYRPFRPYFDVALGAEVTSLAQWNRTMREKHADLTDSPSKGQLSARKDRCEQDRQERRRHG